MGGPPKSILAISDLNLAGSTDRADVPIGNAQQSLLQQRDRWFESGSLQRRVSNELYRRWASMESGRNSHSQLRSQGLDYEVQGGRQRSAFGAARSCPEPQCPVIGPRQDPTIALLLRPPMLPACHPKFGSRL
jgi:hypothetical protein